MIFRAQDLFISYTACGCPHFGNRASQTIHQMKTECANSSPTQEPNKLCKGTAHPTSNCFARSQLFFSHASSIRRCSLPSHLPLIIPCLSKAEVLVLPLSSPLGFCLIKECHVNARSKRKRVYVWLLSGWVRSWNGLCRSVSSLPLSQLPDALGPATERRRKEMRLLEFIHTAHSAALASLPVCMEVSVPLTKGEGKEKQAEREREEMMVREDRLFPG